VKPSYTDTYEVKFWAKNEQGYIEQYTDNFHAHGKDRHKEAVAHIKKKWNLKDSDIINCTYQ